MIDLSPPGIEFFFCESDGCIALGTGPAVYHQDLHLVVYNVFPHPSGHLRKKTGESRPQMAYSLLYTMIHYLDADASAGGNLFVGFPFETA